MKLSFEKWLEDQIYAPEINKIFFEEAIICYKAGAYRAALLFSFTGFQRILKKRILHSSILPIAYELKEEEWSHKKKALMNEDNADKVLGNYIRISKPEEKIFDLTDDLKQQYIYWSYRRNDCAHGKNNPIEASHVESLWSFIISNEGKFHINGGKLFLIANIQKYLDSYETPENESPEYIVEYLRNHIPIEESGEIFKKVIELCNSAQLFEGYILSKKQTNLLISFFDLEEHKPFYLGQLKKELNLLFELFCCSPRLVQLLKNDDCVRILWKKYLPAKRDYRASQVFIELIKHDVIPFNQQEEAIDLFLNDLQYKDDFFENANELTYFNMTKSIIPTLESMLFDTEYPRLKDFTFANNHKWLITFYLKYSLEYKAITSSEFTQKIHETFENMNYPYQLADTLRYKIQNDSSFSDKLNQLFQNESLEMPANLQEH